jgi:ATP-dependent RNA helicase DeaD
VTDLLVTEPAAAFTSLGLEARLVEPLTAAGYIEPTPIQREAIPLVLAGKDLIGLAATGTGKTAAFALPLIQRLAANPARRKPAVLILVPTRELAIQVAAAVRKYGQPLGVTALPVYGGAGFSDQAHGIRRGADVIVATPGRALDHLRRETLSLASIGAVVLDEADEMLDMGFAEELDAILAATPKERQTLLFSATMPPRIVGIAQRHLTDPVRIEVARPRLAAGEAPKVRHTAYLTHRDYKLATLARVIDFESPTSAIIFCRTRTEADEVADVLGSRGYKPEALHGGMSQEQRDRVMKRFRDGAVNLLVATDVAARGLDIGHLSHVINYGVPQHAEVYVHRTGRVGRAGREGVAITLVEPRERFAMQGIARFARLQIEDARVPTVAELKTKRLDRTRDALRALLRQGELEEFKAAVAPLAAEFDSGDVAAAALALAAKTTRTVDDEIEIPAPAPRAPRPVGSAPRPPRTPGFRSRRPARGMAEVFVSAGRDVGVVPRDLIAAIGSEVGLTPRDVGSIEVGERFSLIEVPADIVDHVVESLQGVRLRGRKVTVRRDRSASPVR